MGTLTSVMYSVWEEPGLFPISWDTLIAPGAMSEQALLMITDTQLMFNFSILKFRSKLLRKCIKRPANIISSLGVRTKRFIPA